MLTIENYAEHDFDFADADGLAADEMTEGAGAKERARISSALIRNKGLIKFAKCSFETDSKGDKKKVPSKTQVKDEIVAKMQQHRVAKDWFADGMLRVVEPRNRKALEGAKA